MSNIIDNIFRQVAVESLGYETGMKHLLRWIPRLGDLLGIGNVSLYLFEVKAENVKDLCKLYVVLFREIVGKRRLKYDIFFEVFLPEMIETSYQIVFYIENVEDYFNCLKECLKLRYFVPNRGLLYNQQDDFTEKLCIMDENLREIVYPAGLYIQEDSLRDLIDIVEQGYSANFRMICERYLYSSEYVSDESDLVIAAKGACRRRAEKQSVRSY